MSYAYIINETTAGQMGYVSNMLETVIINNFEDINKNNIQL